MTTIPDTGSYLSDITHDWYSPVNRHLQRLVTGLSISALVVSLSATRHQPPPSSIAIEDQLELDFVAIERQVAAMK